MKKIKGSVSSINPDAALLLFCFGILLACPVRVYQILKLIETETGFYSDVNNWSVIALYAILGAVAAIVFLFSYLSKNIPAAVMPEKKKIPLGIVSVIMSLSFLTDIVTQASILREASGGAGISYYGNIFGFLRATQTLQNGLEIVFAVLSCIYMLVFAVSFLTGNKLYDKVKVLALSPFAWCIFRIFARITKKISFIQVSDLLFEIIGITFLMIFFFTFARVASNVNCENSMWSTFACGISSALVMLTYSIPRLMLMITGNADRISAGTSFEICDIAAAVFIIVFLITMLRSGYALEIPERKITVITPDMQNAEDGGQTADTADVQETKEENAE